MRTVPLDRSQLAEAYSDPEFTKQLLSHLAVADILRSCIIKRNYIVPDKLNNAIALTPAGVTVRTQMIKREEVPAKEAKLLTFLAMVHVEPLIDFDKTNLDDILDAIGSSIVKGDILFPQIYGKDLYEAAASLFKEERQYLRHEDTLKLLENGPIGVFHVFDLLVGPYGVLRTPFLRSLAPTTLVPLQHCSDPACPRVHRVQLTTSIDAAINRHRPALNKVLDDVSADPSDWNGYVSDRMDEYSAEFDDDGTPGVPVLIAEALDDDELRNFFAYAMNNTGGTLRSVSEKHGVSGDAHAAAAVLNKSQMLQLLLTESDDTLVRLLDAAVLGGVLNIPKGEVRRPRINGSRFTAWHLRPELSCLGFRSVGPDIQHADLRLAAIIRELYDLNDPNEAAELEWLLRDSPDEVLEARLERLLTNVTPPELVRRLMFARRQNLTKVCSILGVEPTRSDAEVLEQTLWKLGFPVSADPGEGESYWVMHRKFERTVRASGARVGDVASEVRGAAADHAVALEGYLEDALIFATWALIGDHYSAKQAFVYRPSVARASARGLLADASKRQGFDGLGISDKLTLSVLAGSFGVLSRELDYLESRTDRYIRRATDHPRFSSRTRMQAFPFVHTVPFLDLDAESRIEIKALLLETTSRLAGSEIAKTRNAILHANREPVHSSVIADALDEVARALSRLENGGLAPKFFTFTRLEGDEWGRSAAVLTADDEDDVVRLVQPTRFSWLGMPSTTADQLVIRLATFGSGTQYLRFRRGFDSAYETYWAELPRRRERGNAVGADTSDSLASPLQTGAYVSSRAD